MSKEIDAMEKMDFRKFGLWWNGKLSQAERIAENLGKDYTNEDIKLECLSKAISDEVEGNSWNEKMSGISKRFSIDINDPKGYAEAMRLVDKTDETDNKIAKFIELEGGDFKDFKQYRTAMQTLHKLGDL